MATALERLLCATVTYSSWSDLRVAIRMGPLLAFWAVAVLGQAGKADVATGADLRFGGGLMALSPNDPASLATDLALTLLAGVRVASERTSFVVRYRPTYYYQIPSPGRLDLPLFLHDAESTLTTHLDRRTTFDWTARGTVGELSYASLLRYLPTTTSAAGAPLMPLVLASTNVSLGYRVTQRQQLGVGAGANYRSTFGLGPDGGAGIPNSANVTVNVFDQITLNQTNDLTFRVAANYLRVEIPEQASISGVPPDNFIVSPALVWNHRPSEVTTLEATLGINLAGLSKDAVFSVYPTASVMYRDEAKWLGSRWGTSLSTGMSGYADPLLGTFRPQAFLSGSIVGTHADDIETTAMFAFSTSVATEPLTPAQYESSGQALLRVGYAPTPLWSIFCGASWQLRAGHYLRLDDITPQHQAMAFIGLRIRLGTGSSRGGWL